MASQHASFVCLMFFTNLVIVCYQAAIWHHNMHHLCVIWILQTLSLFVLRQQYRIYTVTL